MADEFVKMEKDGEIIYVSPLCVQDHRRLGWKVIEDVLINEVPPAPARKSIEPEMKVAKNKHNK
jgi:hypothetical protein